MGWLLRVFGWLAAVLAVVVIAVRANFDDVRYSAIVWLATPNKPFVEASAFDYASADGWAALPGAEETAPVDVFVVPATLYFMPYKDSWNLRPDDAGSKAFLDRVLPGLRPLYKDCCKIYSTSRTATWSARLITTSRITTTGGRSSLRAQVRAASTCSVCSRTGSAAASFASVWSPPIR
jgi:hypothetical protein